MRSLLAFMKKETTAQLRSGKLMIIGILFVLLGVMNPAVAKLTPLLLELMSDALAETGMNVTVVEVSAMDSWVQFFKNMPIGLIVFIVLQSSIFTKEYSSGTLILSLTKGLERFKVVISKAVVLSVIWTVGYWLCFAITYVSNAYFWDNSVAQSLVLSVVCWWLFGELVISLTVLFSTIAKASTGVLLGTGGVVLASYMVGMIPKVNKFLPTFLTNGSALIYGVEDAGSYTAAIIISVAAAIICFAISIPLFNKKQL